MAGEPRVQRIALEELPELLTQLGDEQTTKLALIGPNVRLTADNFPQEFQGHFIYQLSSRLSKPPQELLQLEQLTSLDLRSNQVGAEGAQAIAQHLSQLTSLNLRSNQVGAEGAQAIAQHLSQLTSLNLWNNQVGDEGAQAIAQHLS
ncbi:MAG: hypothetical protein AAFR30_13535, partial [Cyanobacteria bacterium J06628_4]